MTEAVTAQRAFLDALTTAHNNLSENILENEILASRPFLAHKLLLYWTQLDSLTPTDYIKVTRNKTAAIQAVLARHQTTQTVLVAPAAPLPTGPVTYSGLPMGTAESPFIASLKLKAGQSS